jgi:hypothetical protein
MDNYYERKRILSSLKGEWQSYDSLKIIFTIPDHISAKDDQFRINGCKRAQKDRYEEQFIINFFWTNEVLRVYFEEKHCIVCFIAPEMSIGFFQSKRICNEINDEDLVIKFKKIISSE